MVNEKTTLSDCEQMVMKCIWDSGRELRVQEITDDVNRNYQREWKLQTVSTFISRLVKKGYLDMYRKGRTFFYRPLIEEKEYRNWLMAEYIKFWNGGNLVDFVCGLCACAELSDEEKQKIKDTIDAEKQGD